VSAFRDIFGFFYLECYIHMQIGFCLASILLAALHLVELWQNINNAFPLFHKHLMVTPQIRQQALHTSQVHIVEVLQDLSTPDLQHDGSNSTTGYSRWCRG
jgi:hypothetical protein